jgi:DUF971 family protein
VSAPAPLAITLSRPERMLVVDWGGGRVSRFPSLLLREQCRCGPCESGRRAGAAPVAPQNIDILDVVPYGPCAVQLRFTDGHERGIYPFAYLYELGERLAHAR